MKCFIALILQVLSNNYLAYRDVLGCAAAAVIFKSLIAWGRHKSLAGTGVERGNNL
ncbi:hypothetical protein CHELA40_13500 [Chelatococcus asaccharovorans]|nr:hypothetical protein CHELA40_13500 [Chelatococcus asaccharovorans]CAH1677591.1 hypothetical protein CHELA17_62120 [Chelatococcus asaccharovorans]